MLSNDIVYNAGCHVPSGLEWVVSPLQLLFCAFWRSLSLRYQGLQMGIGQGVRSHFLDFRLFLTGVSFSWFRAGVGSWFGAGERS